MVTPNDNELFVLCSVKNCEKEQWFVMGGSRKVSMRIIIYRKSKTECFPLSLPLLYLSHIHTHTDSWTISLLSVGPKRVCCRSNLPSAAVKKLCEFTNILFMRNLLHKAKHFMFSVGSKVSRHSHLHSFMKVSLCDLIMVTYLKVVLENLEYGLCTYHKNACGVRVSMQESMSLKL